MLIVLMWVMCWCYCMGWTFGLQRNLKEMVELGLSAKQEKEGRILDIKREVTDMVKSRVLSLQAQVQIVTHLT